MTPTTGDARLSPGRLQAVILEGAHVRLEPLCAEHAGALLAAANADRTTFAYTNVPADAGAMDVYIATLVGDAADGSALPFAQRRLADGQLVGCTRFLNIMWWPNRPYPAEVEIGGTWLTTSAQRTAINTEAKLLLLTHAFETWGVHRVAICTDAANARSRTAIERLGATFEGVLRNHRASMGHSLAQRPARNSAMYSIIPEEWPGIRQQLLQRLA
jgi:N-acetyltransferase